MISNHRNEAMGNEYLMELKEQVIQKLPYRCPYCDEPVSYDQLKEGENTIECPSCQKTYIKVVSKPSEDEIE